MSSSRQETEKISRVKLANRLIIGGLTLFFMGVGVLLSATNAISIFGLSFVENTALLGLLGGIAGLAMGIFSTSPVQASTNSFTALPSFSSLANLFSVFKHSDKGVKNQMALDRVMANQLYDKLCLALLSKGSIQVDAIVKLDAGLKRQRDGHVLDSDILQKLKQAEDNFSKNGSADDLFENLGRICGVVIARPAFAKSSVEKTQETANDQLNAPRLG